MFQNIQILMLLRFLFLRAAVFNSSDLEQSSMIGPTPAGCNSAVSDDTVDWNLFATELFCKYLRMFKMAKNTIAKNFNVYIVFIVVMNFRKNFSIAKFFPSRFPGIFTILFKRKTIPVYSNIHVQYVIIVC